MHYHLHSKRNITVKSAIAERLQHVHVMIVTMNPQVADIIAQMLAKLFFTNTRSVFTTADAIATMRHTRIDLIVTDYEIRAGRGAPEYALFERAMPAHQVLTGIHFIERLRNSPASPNPYVPVLLLGQDGSDAFIMGARDAGADEVLVKPLNGYDFCNKLISIIDNARDFVTAPTYKGPCRRRNRRSTPREEERRVQDVRLLRYEDGFRL